jgi:hypothetical protein
MTEGEELAYDSGVIDGRDTEHERTVHLIEGLFAKSVLPGYQTAVADAVALIKGENK